VQAASASADAAASTETEVFGQRGQWRLRESLKRRRATPSSTDALAATYPPVTSQTSSSLTPAPITAHRCTSCDKPGHANNEDPRCVFYRRNRGQIDWAPNHPDSQLGNTVPHISETQIRISCNGVEQTEAHREPYWYRNQVIDIEVDGHTYRLGNASGDECNCLIDTLRQKLPGIICNISWVRQELENIHRGKDTQIIPGDYLPLDFWDDIVDLLISNNAVTQVQRESRAHRFRVVCVELTWIGHGEVFPRGASSSERTSLIIARVNQNHFVPLIRVHDRQATSRRRDP
jgi:hypothetical protein